MKFHEYLTYGIIFMLMIDLFYRLFNRDWGNIGLSITALIGWFYIQGYERQERKEREAKFMDDRFTA